MTKARKEILNWIVIIGVIATLYLTGLHTEVIGRVQQAVLATGIIKPGKGDTKSGIDADYNLQLVSLDGERISLENLKGKVIFMNLWATWCPPCIAEMPGIQELYNQTPKDDVAFVMLSLDDDLKKVRRFIQKKGYTFPVYMLAMKLPAVYDTNSIPTTYIISSNGKIVLRKEGMANYNSQSFKTFLLNQKSTENKSSF
jgi:thiol-disulfide isomerase/thioredoxin